MPGFRVPFCRSGGCSPDLQGLEGGKAGFIRPRLLPHNHTLTDHDGAAAYQFQTRFIPCKGLRPAKSILQSSAPTSYFKSNQEHFECESHINFGFRKTTTAYSSVFWLWQWWNLPGDHIGFPMQKQDLFANIWMQFILKLIKKLNCSWSRSGGRLIWSNIGQKISSTFQKQGWAGGGGPCSSARQIDASENFCSQPSQEELKQFRPPTDLWKQKFESNWKYNSYIS